MARRKRLSPATALTDAPDGAAQVKSAPPPIAAIVADVAGRVELIEAAQEHREAREDGRLVVLLPVEAVEAGHLVRDRLVANDTELDALKASIAARGQQVPIEVEDLGNGRYGLISGWRRLVALKALRRETDDKQFGQIKAFIRTLETISDAYIAMVEENEIRANLSFYERARIADQAAEKGVFPTAEIAVRELFRHASRAKRSKILSFLRLYRALDGLLRFPTALSERQGLAVVKALEAEPAIEGRIQTELEAIQPETAEDEANALTDVIYSGPFYTPPGPRAAKHPASLKALPTGIRMNTRKGRIELTGTGIDEEFIADLKIWLSQRNGARNSL